MPFLNIYFILSQDAKLDRLLSTLAYSKQLIWEQMFHL